jgi:hypothetical protein
MDKMLAELTTEEFSDLLERTLDRRLEVWFTQLTDALVGSQAEEGTDLQADFSASLRRSIEQARAGAGADLETFRKQVTP